MAGEAGGQTALIFTPSSVATMKKGAAWSNRPEGDLIMSSTCEISPREDFSSGRLTDCAAYGKPRSGLTRIADHEAVWHTAQWVISDFISQQRERACRSAFTIG